MSMGDVAKMGALESITVRFEACHEFRADHDDTLVCACGWLEDDHVATFMAAVTPVRRRRPAIRLPERRAS
jgi:hypothetical protein